MHPASTSYSWTSPFFRHLCRSSPRASVPPSSTRSSSGHACGHYTNKGAVQERSHWFHQVATRPNQSRGSVRRPAEGVGPERGNYRGTDKSWGSPKCCTGARWFYGNWPEQTIPTREGQTGGSWRQVGGQAGGETEEDGWEGWSARLVATSLNGCLPTNVSIGSLGAQSITRGLKQLLKAWISRLTLSILVLWIAPNQEIITHILRFFTCQSSRSYIINSDRGDSSHVYLKEWPVTQTKALFSLPAPQKTSFFFGAAEKSLQNCQEILGSANTKVVRSKILGVWRLQVTTFAEL